MLRCRRCRRAVTDRTCVAAIEAADERAAAACTIWHMEVEALPDWMLSSVQQAQWTAGKLSCQSCGARLGGFNFISHRACPCGRDATVHLNKSRVDRDHQRRALIVQPRRSWPERRPIGPLTDGSRKEEQSAGVHRGAPDAGRLNAAAVLPAEAPPSPADGSLTVRSEQVEADGDAAPGAVARRRSVSAGRRAPPGQHPPTVEEAESSPGTVAPHEEAADSALLLGGGTDPGGASEQEELENRTLLAPPEASNGLSRREKNRLKSLRRKQRRRERWLLHQLERQQQAGSVSAGVSDGEQDSEGLTCAVCLDVYFSPHSCRPCAHVFCEPCLRTLAKNRAASTPCPLCRTLITHTSLHKELDQTARTSFPKIYDAHKQNFQNSSCIKWPLPSCRKHFRDLWGHQRPRAHGRWHFALVGFSLDASDLAGVGGWLFGLAVIYIHPVNWILAFLLLCLLMCCFYL